MHFFRSTFEDRKNAKSPANAKSSAKANRLIIFGHFYLRTFSKRLKRRRLLTVP